MSHHIPGRTVIQAALLSALLLLFTLPLQAAVVARLSSPTTGRDQPVQLTLESQGEQTESPDLSVLDADFEIVGRASQQSVSIINGVMSSKRSLILTLLPKRQGKLTIPPIAFGSQQTDPLQLEVTQQPSSGKESAAQPDQAWLEMSLNKQTAYPEEEVILTLRLYQAAGVRGESLDEPQPSLGDTRLQLLDESSYTTEKDGSLYRVLERSYGLYAYQTGELKISPVLFRGRTGGNDVFSLLEDPFGRSPQASRTIVARSKPVSLQVKPIPSAFTGNQWLPARNLELVETGIGNSASVVAGKPLTRRIMLIADGLMSSQLPAISQQTPDDIKVYEERPQLQDTPRKTGISSSRENVVTLIPTHAGSFTLPAIEIPWWNTSTGRQEIARLPAVTLEVQPGADTVQPTVALPAASPSADLASREAGTAEPLAPAPEQAESGRIHWLVWLLGAAWLATLAGWWISHRRRRPEAVPSEPPAAPAKAAHDDLDAAIDALTQAYGNSDAEAARTAWLRWGQASWPQNPPNNLTRLAGRCPPPVAAAVISLEKALYSPEMERDWTGSFDPRSLRQPTEPAAADSPAQDRLLPLNP